MKRTRASLAAEAAAKGPSEPRTPKQELMLRRRNRRKVDFKTLAGVLRESTRNYLDLLNGDVSLEMGEVRGRAIARHREILLGMLQQQGLLELTQELQAMRKGNTTNWDRLADMSIEELDALPSEVDKLEQIK
jgi:hypothetical protein